MKNFIAITIILFFCTHNLAADKYSVSSIPEKLKQDANAVIRESSEKIIQQDLNNGSYKVTYAITILNQNGRKAATLSLFQDSYMELKSFSGEIFNANGQSIKKISKNDLTTTAISSHLATDDKWTFYECYAPSFPFTVRYEYEIKLKNGIVLFPTYIILPDFNISVESSEYELTLPKNSKLRYKQFGTIPNPEITDSNNNQKYVWKLQNIPAISYEPFCPSYREIFPLVYLSPAEFCIDNNCGNMESWGNFGIWQSKLLQDRDQLPPATTEKIKNLVKDIPDNREKVKILYEFLQETTRYVSIQLGIGGWRPMSASDVSKTGFGDCKALSNYMKAMLKAIDIPSYYTVISMSNKEFFPDFPSFNQADHVILMVPFEKDSVWLECTSQSLPFGYLHSDIMGHDAFVIKDNQSFLCRLPSYPDSTNQEINRITVNIKPSGDASMNIFSTYKTALYESMLSFAKSNDAKEKNKNLINKLNIQKPQIINIEVKEFTEDNPFLNVSYQVEAESFASKTGSRLFVPLNPAKTVLKGAFTASSRKLDINIEQGLHQSDTIIFRIPDTYEVEVLPKTDHITSDFGSFSSHISQDGKILTYIQQLNIEPATYPASSFPEMKSFFNRTESLQSGKILLKIKPE